MQRFKNNFVAILAGNNLNLVLFQMFVLVKEKLF